MAVKRSLGGRLRSTQPTENSTILKHTLVAPARMETESPALAIAFHKFVVSLLAERLKNREEELKSLL